jgi:hypothetical protein
MREIVSGLAHTVMRRDGERCCRCGGDGSESCLGVYVLYPRRTYDRSQRKWFDDPAKVGDCITLCGDCERKATEEQERKRLADAARKARRKPETAPLFGEEWLRKGDPRLKYRDS